MMYARYVYVYVYAYVVNLEVTCAVCILLAVCVALPLTVVVISARFVSCFACECWYSFGSFAAPLLQWMDGWMPAYLFTDGCALGIRTHKESCDGPRQHDNIHALPYSFPFILFYWPLLHSLLVSIRVKSSTYRIACIIHSTS